MEGDIVAKLNQNGVTHLVEEIFSYLDYSDIKSATQVSRNWRHLLLTNSRLWKNLWDRNITHLPTWNLLYKRAVCLQTIPEWNPQEACKVVGDAYQQVLRNLQNGRCTEKVDTESKSYVFKVGSTKVVTANANQIQVQNRWNLKEEASSFDITNGSQRICQLEINEPYLIMVTYRGYSFTENCSVIVFDLEKEKKIHEFTIRNAMDGMPYTCVNVKCNNKLLFTCCSFQRGGDFTPFPYSAATLITASQMPCDAHPETDFPVIDELNIPDIFCLKMLLEDQRIVLFRNSNAYIVSIEPLRIMRKWEIATEDSDDEVFTRRATKYWNGWRLKGKGDPDNNYYPKIKITNIDTGEDTTLDIKHLDFDFVNNHLVILSRESDFLTFDVWNVPQSANGFIATA